MKEERGPPKPKLTLTALTPSRRSEVRLTAGEVADIVQTLQTWLIRENAAPPFGSPRTAEHERITDLLGKLTRLLSLMTLLGPNKEAYIGLRSAQWIQ